MLTKITVEYDSTDERDGAYLQLCEHGYGDVIRAVPGMTLVLEPADGDDVVEMMAVALAVTP